MYYVELKVGRLFEARFEAPVTMAEVKGAVLRTRTLLLSRSERVIGCTDLRKNKLTDDEVTATFVQMLKQDNPKIERSAFLVSPADPVYCLQIERMLREAGNPARRAFRDPARMFAWLSDALTPAEMARARAFVRGH